MNQVWFRDTVLHIILIVMSLVMSAVKILIVNSV